MRLAREHLLVGAEGAGRVSARDRHGRQSEPSVGGAGVGGGRPTVSLLGAVEITEVEAHEPQRVQRLGVACAAPDGFLETRSRGLRLPPTSASQPTFTRAFE